jgi:hypothetical protein
MAEIAVHFASCRTSVISGFMVSSSRDWTMTTKPVLPTGANPADQLPA